MWTISRFAEDRLNYSINSDDPLICDTNQEKEYKVSFIDIGLNAAELTRAVSLTDCTFDA